MKFNIRGDKLEVTDAIRNYIESKLSRLDKYFENADELQATVLIKKQGIAQKVEVTIPMKKIILRSEEAQKDLYASIDLVVDKLERQIRKNKTRIKNKHSKDIVNMFTDFETVEEEENVEEIVKRKVVELKPMSEEEAILQMNLLGHEFFVFENADTEKTSVIYKRKDGNYGLIEMK